MDGQLFEKAKEKMWKTGAKRGKGTRGPNAHRLARYALRTYKGGTYVLRMYVPMYVCTRMYAADG